MYFRYINKSIVVYATKYDRTILREIFHKASSLIGLWNKMLDGNVQALVLFIIPVQFPTNNTERLSKPKKQKITIIGCAKYIFLNIPSIPHKNNIVLYVYE